MNNSNLWIVSIEDEHGSFGGTCERLCRDEESTRFWLYNHLKNLDYLCLLNFRFTEFSNFDNELPTFLYKVNQNYDNYEYGGRYYIDLYEADVYEMPRD